MENAELSQALEASAEPESVNGDGAVALSSFDALPVAIPEAVEPSGDDVVRVDIKTTSEEALDGGEPTITTHVSVETPSRHPDLKVPTDPQAYLDQAKAAIAEANRLTAGRAAGKKRKAMEMFEDDEEFDEEIAAVNGLPAAQQMELVERPAKRLRQTETELRKEKIKRRALTGIIASMAIGYVLSPTSLCRSVGRS